MEHVIGIDPSLTATGVVVLQDNGKYFPKLFESSPPPEKLRCMATRIHRAESLADRVVDWVAEWGQSVGEPIMVMIEGYSHGSAQYAHQLGEYGGLLRAKLLRHLGDELIVEAPPATLKQFAAGKGNANKTAVTNSLTRRYACDFGGCQDLYDAFGLAKLAACVLGWDEATNDGQRKAVEKIRAMGKVSE